MRARKAFRRNAKIGEEPDRPRRCGTGQFPDDIRNLIFRKTIEDEMGDDQIVRALGWCPRLDVALMKSNPVEPIGQLALDSLPRQTQHPVAGVHAIDFNRWMPANQLAEEPPIPLAHDKDAAGSFYFVEAGDPSPL